jgi:formylmethanofuran dehydrogenase subunit E
MKKSNLKTYVDAIEFHGHSCPGLALGFRVAVAALKWLDANRDEDEEIVAIVENDSCAADAIQVLTGCTFGKGNLVFKDIGKRGYTFCNRQTGKSIRIVEHYAPFESPQLQELKNAVFGGTATEKQREEWQLFFQNSISNILCASENALLSITAVNITPPPKAQRFNSLVCSRCGEKVMEPRALKIDSIVFCADCVGNLGK